MSYFLLRVLVGHVLVLVLVLVGPVLVLVLAGLVLVLVLVLVALILVLVLVLVGPVLVNITGFYTTKDRGDFGLKSLIPISHVSYIVFSH